MWVAEKADQMVCVKAGMKVGEKVAQRAEQKAFEMVASLVEW